MITTQQPVLRRFWHAVMPLSQLASGQPQPFQLLGENIVLWQREDGSVACLKDRCCHRSAKLSLGYVEDGNLVCGYHGWAFAQGGACVRVPQRPADAPIPSSYCVAAYRAEVRYGYVWVALGEPLAPIPEMPEADLVGYRQVHQFYEPWKCAALRLMENSFDAAHGAFVHRATFGNTSRPEAFVGDVATSAFGLSFDTKTAVDVRGDVAAKAVGTSDALTERVIHSQWFMPFVRRTVIRYPHGLVHVIVTCATPVNDDTTMVVQWAWRNDTEEDTPAAEVVAFDRAVVDEDRFILESTDPDVPLAVVDGEEFHMGSDRPGIVMRRMLADLLKAHGEVERRRGAVGLAGATR